MPQTALPKDRYLNATEIFDLASAWAQQMPSHCRVENIGVSGGGRPLFVLTIAADLIKADEQPAVWIDGLTHASERASAMACMATAEALLEAALGRGDERARAALLRATYYICPVISPDGLDYLIERGGYIRSVSRDYRQHRKLSGWRAFGIGEQRQMLQLRWPSPHGRWVECPGAPDIMVPRTPLDKGPRYHVVPDGALIGCEAHEISREAPIAAAGMGSFTLDLNRNWPADWSSSSGQGSSNGSGDHPLSEPETQAVAQFMVAHRNIVVVNSHHTCGGGLLLPSSVASSKSLPEADRARLLYVEELARHSTRYRAAFLYDESMRRGHPLPMQGGVFHDYAYGVLGCLAMTTEIWSLAAAVAGEKAPTSFHDSHAAISDRAFLGKLHTWLKERYGTAYLRPFEPYEHPQLGMIVRGGVVFLATAVNPPVDLLAKELERLTVFNLDLAAMVPRLYLADVKRRVLGEGLIEVSAALGNDGFLPTYGTERALTQSWCTPLAVTLESGEEWQCVSSPEHEIKALRGYGDALMTSQQFGLFDYLDGSVEARRVRWVLSARQAAAGPLTVVAKSQRAGTVRVLVP